jgi:hypothetical protein
MLKALRRICFRRGMRAVSGFGEGDGEAEQHFSLTTA